MSTAFATDQVRRPAGLAAATARPLAPEAPRPDLTAVPATRARARPRAVVAGALCGGVACILAGQLLLSIQTASGAYALTRLQAESVALTRQQQVRAERLETLASPQYLMTRADALGLVPSVSPAYLRLGDGRVLGHAVRAGRVAESDPAVPDALLGVSR